MTIEQANQYFAALPEGFAPAEELRAALPAAAQQVAYVGVAGTAGKTAAAALTAAVLQAAGFVTGLYRAGCEPLEQRVRINGEPVADALLCAAAETLSRAKPLPCAAAELAAAAACFGAAGCRLAVVELPDAGLAEALSHMPVCVVTSIGPDGVSRSVERSAALAAGVMREGAICVTAPEQPKAALSELIVAAGREDCELVVPDPDDITFLEAEKFTSRVDYGGYTVPLAFWAVMRRAARPLQSRRRWPSAKRASTSRTKPSSKALLPSRTAAASGCCRSARSSFWTPAAPRSRPWPCSASSIWPRCAI